MNVTHLSSNQVITGLTYFNFNQDSSFVSIGTEKGYKIYSTFPFAEKATVEQSVNLKFERLEIVEMLYRTNLIAFVGNSSEFPNTRVVLFDHCQNQIVFEIEFSSPVKAIRMRKDRYFSNLINPNNV